MADFDQTEEYRKFVSELNPTSLPIVRISGGRKQRFEHFKKQFQQLKTEMAFGFKYGFLIGGFSGMVLSIPTYIKQRSKLVIVISSLSTGLFFGSLMAVGTIIGKLDDGEGKPSQVDILSTRDENGELGFSSRPYWMPSIKQLNSD